MSLLCMVYLRDSTNLQVLLLRCLTTFQRICPNAVFLPESFIVKRLFHNLLLRLPEAGYLPQISSSIILFMIIIVAEVENVNLIRM